MLFNFIGKRKKQEKSYTFNGQKVLKIQEYNFGVLVENNTGDWNELTDFLTTNSINIYCTYNAFVNFADYTLATGHVQEFINYVRNFVKKYPASIYNLLTNGKITVVEIE